MRFTRLAEIFLLSFLSHDKALCARQMNVSLCYVHVVPYGSQGVFLVPFQQCLRMHRFV